MTMGTQCMRCLRYRGELTCDAFPERIPEGVLTGEIDHTGSVPGDHGIQFALIPMPSDELTKGLNQELAVGNRVENKMVISGHMINMLMNNPIPERAARPQVTPPRLDGYGAALHDREGALHVDPELYIVNPDLPFPLVPETRTLAPWRYEMSKEIVAEADTVREHLNATRERAFEMAFQNPLNVEEEKPKNPKLVLDLVKAAKGDKAASHLYTERKWMKDHWVYTYAKEHGGKIKGHHTDPDKVVLKVPTKKAHKLEELKDKYGIKSPIIHGSYYSMIELTKKDADKLRAGGVTTKPGKPEPETKGLPPTLAELIKNKTTKPYIHAGDQVSVVMGGELIKGSMIGQDYRGRAIIADGSPRHRIVPIMDVRPHDVKSESRKSTHALTDAQKVKASPRIQKIVEATMAEDMIPGRKYGEYIDWLNDRGFEAYMVGGIARDMIAGDAEGASDETIKEAMKDVDIVATGSAKTGELMFRELATAATENLPDALEPGGVWSRPASKEWGVLSAGGAKAGLTNREEGLDYASMVLRGGMEGPTKTAHPDTGETAPAVVFGADIEKDAQRRDFACNSVYYDARTHVFYDPTGDGIEDAKAKILRISAGDAEFKSNTNIAFRFFKFRARGYRAVDAKTRLSIRKNFEKHATYKRKGDAWKPRSAHSKESFMVREMARACGKVCKDPKKFLATFRALMKDDGMADVYDTHIKPHAAAIISSIKETK